MNAMQGLLEAILKEPESDDLRLIYANALEESGESDRAELIRVQIEQARIEPPYNPWCRKCGWVYEQCACADKSHHPESIRRSCALQQRVHHLLVAHYKQWLRADIGRIADHVAWIEAEKTYQRGFVENLALTLERWMQHGPELVKRTPLRSVDITDKSPFRSGRGDVLDWRWFAVPSGVVPPGVNEMPEALWVVYERLYPRIVLKDGHSIVHHHSSPAEAMHALSQACLLWAKSQK